MEYIVRVRHGSGRLEDQTEEFTTDSVVESDLNALSDKASDAYVAAVKKFDAGHTVSLFRDNITMHESKGTGTSKLSDALSTEDADPAGKPGVPPAKVETKDN